MEFHERLDAFDLWVLAQPSPPVDVSTLQAAIKILRTNIYMILEANVHKSKAPYAEPVEDTVLASLFSTSDIPPPPPREYAKRCKG